jgi:hypothetical protein
MIYYQATATPDSGEIKKIYLPAKPTELWQKV